MVTRAGSLAGDLSTSAPLKATLKKFRSLCSATHEGGGCSTVLKMTTQLRVTMWSAPELLCVCLFLEWSHLCVLLKAWYESQCLGKVNPQFAVPSNVRRASLGAFAPCVTLPRGWLCLGDDSSCAVTCQRNEKCVVNVETRNWRGGA